MWAQDKPVPAGIDVQAHLHGDHLARRYIEDDDGVFEWAVPDAEVHTFINDLAAGIGTQPYGRRMEETMAAEQTVGDATEVPAAVADFGQVWRAADKVVYCISAAIPVLG